MIGNSVYFAIKQPLLLIMPIMVRIWQLIKENGDVQSHILCKIKFDALRIFILF